MKEIGNIFLSWRAGSGHRRHIVGVLRLNSTKGVRFTYIPDEVENAKQDGFTPYTEFPDTRKVYDGSVLDIFGQRIIKPERSDKSTFFDFWEIKPEYADNKYYLLAHTMGLLPTDNFEFLADYNPIKGLCFITDLAGLTHIPLRAGSLNVGEHLKYEFDKNNPYDKYAIKITSGNQHIGYIKKIHSKVFHKMRSGKIDLFVKAIDQNGTIKRVFVKVCF